MPVDHATSEVDVRALDARVHDVNTHTLTSKVAVVVLAVDRAACAGYGGWTITIGTRAEARWVARRSESFGCRQLAVSVNAVDAPRSAIVHGQPAGHGLVRCAAVVAGRVGSGQRQVVALEAVKLNRGDLRVLGHARDGLRACVLDRASYDATVAGGRALSMWVRAVGAPHLLARADSNGELGLGEEVQGMRG